MAIFHLNTRTSRYSKAGRIVNSIDHYNYITCQEEYSKNKDLVYMETGRLPNCDEIKIIEDFWKAADQYKRKNGRTYRDVTMALQEEFTIEENIALVHQFFDHFKIREKTSIYTNPYMINRFQTIKAIEIYIVKLCLMNE